MRQQTAELMAGVDHLLAEHIERWMDYDARCVSFFVANKQKVTAKVQDAARSGKERLLDLLFELQMGCLLSLHARLTPSYEFFGDQEAGPDYSMLDRGVPSFHVEVKHVGDAKLDREYKKWIDTMALSVRQMGPGAMVSITSPTSDEDFAPLDLANRNVYVEREMLLTQLKNSTLDIAGFIDDRIRDLPNMELRQSFPVPGFEGKIEVSLMKQSKLTNSSGLVRYSAIPFFKVNQPLRIVGIVCEKLGKGQFKDGIPNVLAIYNTSQTLQRWHVPLAFDLMREAAARGDDDFFRRQSHGRITGARDYLAKSPILTGAWYRTNGHFEKTEKGDATWIETDEMTQYYANPSADPLGPSIVEFLGQLPLISKG
jgi:hypothetical protein